MIKLALPDEMTRKERRMKAEHTCMRRKASSLVSDGFPLYPFGGASVVNELLASAQRAQAFVSTSHSKDMEP